MPDISTALDFTTDLDRGVTLQSLHPALLSGDIAAHRFTVHCIRGGRPASLAGASVQGYFIRADETTVLVPGGVSGSTAFVTLPADCYAVTGRFSLVIRATLSGTVNTVLWVQGSVGRATSATVTDPEAVLPTVEQLLAIISAAEAAQLAAADSAPGIVGEATGEIVAVIDNAARAPRVLNVYGKTTQAATPTPVAPAPLVHVDGVGVKVTGKNLLPLGSVKAYERTGITFTLSDDGTYTVDGTATANTYYAGATGPILLGVLPAGKYTCSVSPVSAAPGVRGTIRNRSNSNSWVAQTGTSSGYTTFTADGTSEYSAGFFVPDGATVDNLTFTLQVERGETATEHEAYTVAGEIDYTGSLPGIPVASGGNCVDAGGQRWIADYIDVPGKQLYTVLGSFTLNGSEGYAWNISDGGGFTVAYIGPQDKWSAHDAALVNDTRLMSSHFVGGLLTAAGQIKLDANFLNLSLPSSLATSEAVNSWLASNPVTVLFVRAEPDVTSVDAPAITLPGLGAAVQNDAGCTVRLAYTADTKTYIDRKFAELQAAILATGSNV